MYNKNTVIVCEFIDVVSFAVIICHKLSHVVK